MQGFPGRFTLDKELLHGIVGPDMTCHPMLFISVGSAELRTVLGPVVVLLTFEEPRE